MLRELSPLVEPLSLDEAFVDLAAADARRRTTVAGVTAVAEQLRARVAEVTGGLAARSGIASSKFVAKVASDLDKPDGLVVVAAGHRAATCCGRCTSTVIPGVGPATAERLRRAGIHTVADLEAVSEDELVRLLGKAHGHGAATCWPAPTTTGRWSPSGRPSRSASRAPTTPTSPTAG